MDLPEDAPDSRGLSRKLNQVSYLNNPAAG
jgi:hypothetical protein